MAGLFERVIVMSGSLFAPWAISHYARDAAQAVAHLIGCRSHSVDEHLLDCLRERDVADILQAFTRHQKDLNTTELFGPVVDSFMPPESAFFGKDPQATLVKGDFDKKMRVMTGVAESEGAGMLSKSRRFLFSFSLNVTEIKCFNLNSLTYIHIFLFRHDSQSGAAIVR